MQVIAITGSIGCGKTTLAGLVRELGYPVYDVDKWCRHLYFEENFLENIKKYFPSTFSDGKFNKKVLRSLVFSQPDELKKLENLTHPFLKKKFLNTIQKHAKSSDIIFIDVAILFEMGWDKYCTYIIVADTDYETQKNRVIKRDNISSADFEKIVKLQMDNNVKKLMADVVIETNKSLGILKTKLLKIITGLE